MAVDVEEGLREVSATEARTQLGEMLNSVESNGHDVIIERGGQQVAVAVSIEDYKGSLNRSLPDEWWILRNQLAASFRRNMAGKRLPTIKEMIDESREALP